MIVMNLFEKAVKILQQPVCDNCLGRQFGQLLSGYTNAERGKMLRIAVAMSIDKSKEEKKETEISNAERESFNYSNTDLDTSNFTAFKFHNLEMKNSIKRKTSDRF